MSFFQRVLHYYFSERFTSFAMKQLKCLPLTFPLIFAGGVFFWLSNNSFPSMQEPLQLWYIELAWYLERASSAPAATLSHCIALSSSSAATFLLKFLRGSGAMEIDKSRTVGTKQLWWGPEGSPRLFAGVSGLLLKGAGNVDRCPTSLLLKSVAVVPTLMRSRAFNTTVVGFFTPFVRHYGCPHVCNLVDAEHHVSSFLGHGSWSHMYLPLAGGTGEVRSSVNREGPQTVRCPGPE